MRGLWAVSQGREAPLVPDAASGGSSAAEPLSSGQAENVPGQAESFQDRCIREHAGGLSFIDVGGLWGTLNEKVSAAALVGARSVAMADIQPLATDLWDELRNRCTSLGVSDYRELCVNLDDPDLHGKVGSYDFVHCAGVIYHAPSPLFSIGQLRRITGRYLLLGSMVVPEQVTNAAGAVDFSGGMLLLLPAMDEARRAVMRQHFNDSGIRIAHINGMEADPFWVGGLPSYSPWWWLYTARTLRAMVEVSGFKVLAQAPDWNGRVSYCFSERTSD
jgi:hypothetical protein